MHNYETIEQINKAFKGTLMETLGIECTKLGKDHVTARMPVDKRTLQPNHILHGGASIALAETIAGLLSHTVIDHGTQESRGIHVSSNHLKSVKDGYVYAQATFIHQGRTTHLVEVKTKDEQGNTISISRVTNIILGR